MPPPNPLMRIEAVANDLEKLAYELEDSVGPDAKRALMYWRSELLESIAALQGAARADAGA